MSCQMRSHGTQVCKLDTALRTAIGLLTSVDAHVRAQVVHNGERLLTNATTIGVRFQVHSFDMSLKSVGRFESQRAFGAHEKEILRVYLLLMVSQVLDKFEGLITLGTGIHRRIDTMFQDDMATQLGCCLELPSTITAYIWMNLAVYRSMRRQCSLLLKSLAAHITRKRALAGVTTQMIN